MVGDITMGKKNKNRNTVVQPLKSIEPTSVSSPQEVVHHDVAVSRGLGKGNTADLNDMFDVLWGDDVEILKDFPEKQKTLIGVLRSMYGSALRLQSRKTVWGKPVLGFEIALASVNDSSIFARLDIDLPPGYPKVPAVIRLDELEPDLEALRQGFKDVIAHVEKVEADDEIMAYSILSGIQDKLEEVAAEKEKRAQGVSLEEERATTEVAAQADATLQQQIALRRKEAEAAATEAKLAQDVEAHRRRRNVLTSNGSTLDESTTAGEAYPEDCVVFDHDITLREPSFDSDLSFRAVRSMSLLYQRDDKIVTVACPFRAGKLIKLQLVLKEVRLPPSIDNESEYRSTLTGIEMALKEIKKFEHAAIVKIHDYKLVEIQDHKLTSHWELFILTEHAQQSLDALLDMVGGLSAVKMRIYTRSILDALEFYDRKGYVHPAIHAHNVLFFGSEHKNYQAKLSDGYGTELRNLVDRAQSVQPSELNQGNWTPPEVIDVRGVRNNKTCIWELGVVLLQMALGNDMMKTYTSPEDALSQANLDQDFDYLISKMCAISARKRPTAFQVQNYQFFKSHQHSVFLSEARVSGSFSGISKSRSVFDSRWASEWEPVEKLGKGGFGVVVKARNRMDGHFYAVKQLKCKSLRDLDDIWGEVKMLAQLNHPGIVRYFGAWREEDQTEATDTDTSTALTDPRSFAPPSDSIAPRSSLFAVPSTGHDFMTQSLAQLSDVEDEEEEEEQQDSESSDDGNLFGYQSAPSDSNGDSQAIESGDDGDEEPSDPFELQAAASHLENEPNFFETNGAPSSKEKTDIPSRPQPFIPAKGTPSLIRRPPQFYNKSTTLYIQMELCETGTLLDLIKNGLPERVEEAWRIFRLLLDGLEYIHEQRVVHRDLKPMNIFIDSQKMPKIGDFGLAAASQATVEGHNLATHIAGPMSKGIGTIFYIAPELDETKASGKYSAKADMFALGVIFFEMCFPFKTSTERINWLQSINRDGSILPNRFEKDEFKIQGRIIRSLLSHRPEQRPSAKELLLDPEVPEPLEEDKEQRYFQRLVQGDPQQLQRVMDNFMSTEANRPQLLAYAYAEQEDFEQPDKYLLDSMKQQLGEVFRAHGGVEDSRQTAFPVEGLYPNPVKFLDAAGFTVQLPYDLTVPFARAIAVKKPEYRKWFCFGSVFRQRKERGVEPLCIPEVDFDIVSFTAKDISLTDAQVISVLDDCLGKLAPLFSRSFTILVSHGDLLDLILRACDVPEGRFEVVKRLLSSLNVGKTTWKQVQPELQASPCGLAITTISALSQFNFSSNFEEMRRHVLANLKKLRKDDFAVGATRTLNRLQEVNDYLDRLRVKTTVLFCPLSNTSEALYRGSLMFKCIESKTSKTIVVGGRYDSLIRSYQTPTHKTLARAAGFRINIMDLASYARSDAQPSGAKSAKQKIVMPPTIMPRVDVVVTSFDETTLYDACIDILRNILEAGISAELSDLFRNMDELDRAYVTAPKYWVVIVRPGGSKIKIRSPTKDETEVQNSELVNWLREEIGEKQSVNNSEPILRRTRSSHGASDRENVVVFTPKHKSKKVNRAAIVDSARTAALELTESMNKSYKVLAIDTDDETLQRLRNTRLADGDSWRALRHTVALAEREYVQQIQEQLQDWSNSGQEGAFLCNYKTKTCISYDFGKNQS